MFAPGPYNKLEYLISPLTSNSTVGFVVPIPIKPLLVITILSKLLV